ncbi:MAG: transcriptional regulator FtsR [Gaiellaceae bacterium]
MTSAASQRSAAGRGPARERMLRIGEVVRRLVGEFPDVSISKIRYLEDEGLLSPRRTQGGYRLFSEDDLERLQTILRLQRDEFLPLRVIRDELDAPGQKERKRRRPVALGQEEDLVGLDELCDRAGIPPELAKELEDFGLLAPRGSGAGKRYPDSDVDVASACAQIARYGVDPRHLRTFRTAAGREAALLGQLVAPALRARSNERRAQGLQDLQQLAELVGELSSLLFWRDLRDLAQ